MGQQTQSMLPFLILIALAAFILFRGSRQRRELQAIQDSLTPGMEVLTSCGMYGTVRSCEGGVVTLEVAPGVTSRWDRRAVVRIIPDAVATPNESVSREADSPEVEPNE